MQRRYQLGTTILKTVKDTKLWESGRGMVEVSKNTLAISIRLDAQGRGYIFHGHGKLLLDTIVETEEGAIGKPVERELNKPFLMLGDARERQEKLAEANAEDLAGRGYQTQQEFTETAETLFNRFFKDGESHSRHQFNKHHGFVFAFQNQNDKLDILVAKGPKLVYTAEDKIFISNENSIVLKSSNGVVCSGNGRSVIIKK